ncbi:2,3-bisphosphoglycerate-dependent phosphoglycerate mutase [Metabacillus malikii]|uniref:2,3-bisphosphoglycerate-dependent phosphoglycerate mutase n=2 Tax=Metabacillus malikii TaxID=1504265 RepID=A0ABT9ZAW7_9BACI|nr:2,3-bisphosphoglycerate-dependent phosphoglycerate mutase [Metabacillus malikii]
MINHVISSPYKRAKQTVEGIADYIGQEIVTVEDLKERVLSNKPIRNFQEAISKLWENDSYSWDGGESNLDAQKRAVSAVQDILQTYEDNNIVIGSHGNIMVLIMNFFDAKYDFEFWRQLSMPDIYQLSFSEHQLFSVKRLWN